VGEGAADFTLLVESLDQPAPNRLISPRKRIFASGLANESLTHGVRVLPAGRAPSRYTPPGLPSHRETLPR
jgi:hypothetical protein